MTESTLRTPPAVKARNYKKSWEKLEREFEITGRRERWELWCNNCPRGFRLEKARDMDARDLVFLHNHAAACRRRGRVGRSSAATTGSHRREVGT